MKKILIDDISNETLSQSSVVIDGVEYKGYNIAKPMNYMPEYMSKSERKEMARMVLEGKAIAVSFFEDLTEEEKINYVKEKTHI